MLKMYLKFNVLCNRHSGPKTTNITLGTNVGTMMTQCCLNVVPISILKPGKQSCHSVHTIVAEYCGKVGPQCWVDNCPNIYSMLPECCPSGIPQDYRGT